jgi:hypothetical protein
MKTGSFGQQNNNWKTSTTVGKNSVARILDQQTSRMKLIKQLADADRRLQNVTESLVVQTTYLANSQKQKRSRLEHIMLLRPQKKKTINQL